MTFSNYLAAQQKAVHSALEKWFEPNRNEKVVEAALYSLLLPSKRLRPLFCIETARALGGKEASAMPAAMALEMVHTYSLVHDDLPAMDNDDLRRGKPTNHKVYGHAGAILAGDGLLTAAFEVLSKFGDVPAEVRVAWVRELSEAAGMNGMVLGQDWDIRKPLNETVDSLERLHRKKTAALFSASVAMGAMAAEGDDETIEHLRIFAQHMGLAFQIRDDVLDVEGDASLGKPIRSDEKNNKGTYVSLLGLPRAKEEYKNWYAKALNELSKVKFVGENHMEDLTRFVVERRV